MKTLNTLINDYKTQAENILYRLEKKTISKDKGEEMINKINCIIVSLVEIEMGFSKEEKTLIANVIGGAM
jgi:hypothetical protein